MEIILVVYAQVLIKEAQHARMSESAEKKQKVLDERKRDEIVIISNAGDIRPDETVPDTMATFFLDQLRSVRSYVCVPGIGVTKFLANWQYTRTDDLGNVTYYGRRYVKQMITSTSSLTGAAGGIDCDVMFLFCHGKDRSSVRRTPAYIAFHEDDSVDVNGNHRDCSAPASRIWACSSYTEGGQTFTKPRNTVHLSEVVNNAKLVVMLCCHSHDILHEHESEDGTSTNEFVSFNVPTVHEPTINIFLALLITSIESCTLRTGPWNELIKRNVCQVMLWVQKYGEYDDEERFWNFLLTKRIVTMTGHVFDDGLPAFRINGSIHHYPLFHIEKQDVLLELQTLNLRGGSCTTATHASITHERDENELIEWTNGKAFTQSSHTQQEPASLDVLLLQLKGLLYGA